MNIRHLIMRLCVGLTVLLGLLTPAWAVDNVIYYHNDALGSPVAITDNTGQVLWREAYEPYGKRVSNAGGHNTLWYTGKPEDKELGLSYFGARWYDPTVGRFTGIDPVDVQADNIHSFNRYAYANNNPYRYVDPDGRLGTSIHALQRGMTLDNALWVGAAGDSALYTAGGSAAAVASVAMPDPSDVGIAGALITKGLSKATKGAAGGERAGKRFTRAGKAEVKADNAAAHGGQTTCTNCGQPTVPGQQSRAGVTPPKNETHVDHIIPKSKGGNGSPNNGQVLCRDCNLRKGAD